MTKMSGDLIRARNKIKRVIAEVENHYYPNQVSHPIDIGVVKGLQIALSFLPSVSESYPTEILLLTYERAHSE
jgi:hypothetical protein